MENVEHRVWGRIVLIRGRSYTTLLQKSEFELRGFRLSEKQKKESALVEFLLMLDTPQLLEGRKLKDTLELIAEMPVFTNMGAIVVDV